MHQINCHLSFESGFASRYPRDVRSIKIFMKAFIDEAIRPYFPEKYPPDGVEVTQDGLLEREKDGRQQWLLVDIGLPSGDQLASNTMVILPELRDELLELFPQLSGHLELEIGPFRLTTAV
jgi:hypothetical protein